MNLLIVAMDNLKPVNTKNMTKEGTYVAFEYLLLKDVIW